MTRRAFFSFLVAPSRQQKSVAAVVIEAFDSGTGAMAVLVHQAEPAARDAFAMLLRSHPKNSVRVLTKTGEGVPARIFRVRMCFGRGLILFERPMRIRERDMLTIAF